MVGRQGGMIRGQAWGRVGSAEKESWEAGKQLGSRDVGN